MSVGKNPAVTAQLAALRDPNPARRLAAALALQDVGGYLDQTLPVLVNEITSVDANCESHWRSALKFIGRPAIVALANKALDRELVIERRVMALREIACEFFSDHSAATEQMDQLLNGPVELRGWAAVILARAGRPVHSHEAFLGALRSDDSRLVAEAVYALHNFKKRPHDEVQRVKEAVLPCLVHADETVRTNCCMFLKLDLDDSDLRKLDLKDNDPADAVIGLLCKMDAPPVSAGALLIRGLCSDDYDTRETRAPLAILRLGTTLIQELIQLARDQSKPLEARCVALRILGKMKPLSADVLQQIRQFLDATGKLAAFAAVAMAEQGDETDTVIRKLVTGLNDDDHAQRCLRRIPANLTIPPLISYLKVASESEKQHVSMLLGKVGWNSPEAAQAVVNELTFAADSTLRNRLANALKEFEGLAVPPVVNALAT
ncbi:MAG TPA: hypothetical protein PLY87_31525 [Planctomycetaceae bacterium]|nr:hypothetical protein [Planctomycetaceae bacterium]